MAKWPIPEGLDTVEIGGYPLAYQVTGTGAPLVLLHGSLNDYRSWASQIPDFSRSYRVFAPSLRHYFPERWDGNGDDFSLSQHAADVAAFIAALDLGKVHLVGHSRGGGVAYMVARDHPDLVRSLVLAEPRGLEALLPDTPEARVAARELEAVFAKLHENMASGDTIKAAREFVEAFNGPGGWDAMSTLQQTILLDNLGTSNDSGELPGIMCEDIAKFAFPLLLVRGEKSPRRYAMGFDAMRACNAAIPETVVIPNAAHGMHRANPAAFNRAVLDFIATA